MSGALQRWLIWLIFLIAKPGHRDFVSGRIERHLVHERPHQHQPAAAFRIERGNLAQQALVVEARSVVANDELGRVGRELGEHANLAVAVGGFVGSAAHQFRIVVLGAVQLLAGELEIAVDQGVDQGLLQGDAQPHPPRLVAKVEQRHLLLQVIDQRADQRRIVVEHEGPGRAVQPVQQPIVPPVGMRHGEHVLDGVGQVFGQPGLGHVAGRALLQGLHGDLLAAVGRHQHDRHQRKPPPQSPDQLQPVHARHLEVGHDDIGGLIGHQGQRFGPVRRGADGQIVLLFQQRHGQPAIDRRIVNDQD